MELVAAIETAPWFESNLVDIGSANTFVIGLRASILLESWCCR
jgi:hypothetical protein